MTVRIACINTYERRVAFIKSRLDAFINRIFVNVDDLNLTTG